MKKKLAAVLIIMSVITSIAFAGGERETFLVRKNPKDGIFSDGNFNFYLDFSGKGSQNKSADDYSGGRAVEESIDVPEQGSIRIQALTGIVRISAAVDSRILVTGRIGDNIEKLNIEKKEDGTVILSFKWPERKNIARLDLWCDLDIQIPAAYNVLASTLNVDMKISGIRGNLRLETASGEIAVTDCRSPLVRVQTLNGSFTLNGEAKEVRFQTMNGKVDLKGKMNAVYGSSMDGNIRLETSSLYDCDISTMSGVISIDAEPADNARIRAKAQLNGSIELRLPKEIQGLFTVTCPNTGIDLTSFKPVSALVWNFRDGERGGPGTEDRGNEGAQKDAAEDVDLLPFRFRLPFGEFIFEKTPGGRTDKTFNFPMNRTRLFESRTNEFSVGKGNLRVIVETGILDMREFGKGAKGDTKALVILITK